MCSSDRLQALIVQNCQYFDRSDGSCIGDIKLSMRIENEHLTTIIFSDNYRLIQFLLIFFIALSKNIPSSTSIKSTGLPTLNSKTDTASLLVYMFGLFVFLRFAFRNTYTSSYNLLLFSLV